MNIHKPALIRVKLFSFLSLIFLQLTLVAACTSITPLQRYNKLAVKNQLVADHILLDTVSLEYLTNRTNFKSDQTVHIYLEGDGIPYTSPDKVNYSPTSQNFLSLRLMNQDPNPAIYLNRPCYGPQTGENTHYCSPDKWTSARYGIENQAVLIEAIKQLKLKLGFQKAILIGHSGGGYLALAMAPSIDFQVGVVTLAGNIDHIRWSKWNNSPMLDDTKTLHELVSLTRNIPQWHLTGGKDAITPAKFTVEAMANTLPDSISLYPNFDHQCCWEALWPELLRELGDKFQVFGD